MFRLGSWEVLTLVIRLWICSGVISFTSAQKGPWYFFLLDDSGTGEAIMGFVSVPKEDLMRSHRIVMLSRSPILPPSDL